MTNIKLGLDWTPNINHIGFLISKDLGYYEDQGIELELINPKEDNYALTPGKKLELDLVDFAIAPFETVISLNNKKNKVDAVAVYAILQKDLSCIASLKSSALASPKYLDGKTYASYKARYEDHIVRQMIKNDGGKGDIQISYPDKLGIWNTLLEGKADATWIFDNWEGIEAETKGVELNKFTMDDYDIPYGYSPIMIAKRQKIKSNKDLYSKFIRATQKGFLFVKNNPKQSATILKSYLSTYELKNIAVNKSIAMTSPHFGNAKNCGMMNEKRVVDFLNWLVNNNLENGQILKQHLFTNELCSV